MNKKSLKMFFRSLLTKLGSVATDKAVLNWDSDEDLVAGMEVYIERENENGDIEYIAPEDGDYTTEDGKIIKVVDGKVAEILDPSAEVDMTTEEVVNEELAEEELAEETVENPTNEGEETDTEAIVEIRKEINEAYAKMDEMAREIQELRETVAKLAEAPAEQSAIEMSKQIEKNDKTSGWTALRKK